jgi:hypothetical protein
MCLAVGPALQDFAAGTFDQTPNATVFAGEVQISGAHPKRFC